MPNNHTQQRVYHYRSSAITNSEIEKPNANNLAFGEIAINYNTQEPSLFIKQNNSEIAQFVDKKYIEDNINSLSGLNDVNITSPKDEQSLVYDSVSNEYINKYALAGAIPYGRCDSSSTATNFTATVPGITELRDGTCMLLKNGVITSASGFKINVNGLGAKPVYSNMASATSETTVFNKTYTILFIYDETRVSGGCWIYYRGYYKDTTYTNVALGQGYASSTAATSTTAKTATLSSYKLTANGIVSVKFSGDVPANATLNINSAGAKQIYYKGAQITNGVIKAGDTATFMYNTYYHLLTIDRWNSDFSGNYNDLTNKPELSTVATSGSYNDLSNKPTIGNGALTIKRNGTSLGSFSANQTDNKEIDISVPTKTSDLTNDSNYINSAVTSLKNFATSANVVTALDNKVDKVDGKGLSTNDYTNDEKNKLGGIEANAQKNGNAYKLIKVNATGANLSATTSADTFTISAGTNITLTAGTKKVTISAKDTIPGTLTTTATTSLTTATNESLSGSVSLHKVSKTGSYNDLLNKPTIPTVPTKVSEFENDANYITSAVTNLTNFATSSNTVSALNNKVDKVSGKGLSTNDFDNAYKGKLDNIASGAEVNVQSDWNVSDSNSDAYIKNKPTIGNAALTIQKNGVNVGSFSANQTTNKTINIVVPTTAGDVNALPDSTKYAASLSLDINSSTYVVTAQLKDQEGNNLGTQQTIDLPLETMVVSGSYISSAKTVSLVLQNGNKIEFSVADLVSGLQTEITDSNKLSADLIENGNTNKVFTSSEKTKLSNLASSLATTSASGYMSSTQVTKLNGIESGAEVNVQSDWNETNGGSDAYILNKPTIPTVNNGALTITTGTSANLGSFSANQSTNTTVTLHKVVQTGNVGDLTNDVGYITTANTKDFITSAVTAMTNYATSANVVTTLSGKTNQTINVTYSQLVQLKNNSALIPGQSYRITDYTTTTGLENTCAAGHDFDLIVFAVDVNKLDCRASAINHAGDTYFSNAGAELNKWQIWYDINNDANKYNWAKYNGKGVIYRMIDEHDNDCPYDFKNILFTISGRPSSAYTFNDYQGNDHTIYGDGGWCHGNTMKSYINPNNSSIYSDQKLNFNVFYISQNAICIYNTIDFNCFYNTFSGSCSHNKIAINCYYNYIYWSSYNMLDNNCSYNTIITSSHNEFDVSCENNTLTGACRYNHFGCYCRNNTLTYSCDYNTLGNNCQNVNLNLECDGNTLGNNCQNITFNDIATNLNCGYISNNIVGNGNINIILSCNNVAGNDNNKLQNIYIAQGANNTSASTLTINTIGRNLPYRTTVARNSKGELKIYNEADLVL